MVRIKQFQNNKTTYAFCFPLFLALVLLNLNCQNSKSKNTNDLEMSNLKGAVYSITVSQFGFTEIQNKETHNISKKQHQFLEKKHVSWYNKDGYLTERIEYNWSGSIENHILFEYLPNNRLVVGPEGEYLYDKSGKLYLTIFTNVQNDFRKSTRYIYDSKDRLTEKYIYEKDSQLIYHYSYNYDLNNQLIESRYRYYGNALTFRVNEKKQYHYDSILKLKIIKTSGINSDYSEVQELRYNEKNDLIYQKITGSPDDRELTYSYEYDSLFNWIIKREYLNGGLVLLEERTIEYYP